MSRGVLVDAEPGVVTSLGDVDSWLTVLDDWQVLLALRQLGGWDGLVTTDVKMLRLPKEMVVLEQTKLGLTSRDAEYLVGPPCSTERSN
jgi:hypothetical protein